MAKKAKKKAARAVLKKNARPGVKKALGRKAKTAAAKSRWTAPGARDRAAAAKNATKEPKAQPLIKGLRIKALDNVCGHISDTRAAIARLQGEEADLEQQAHKLLQKHDQMTWQFAGVAILRKPGEETLIVKTARSRGPAPAAEPEGDAEPEPIDEQAPVSQTPERAAAVEGADDDQVH